MSVVMLILLSPYDFLNINRAMLFVKRKKKKKRKKETIYHSFVLYFNILTVAHISTVLQLSFLKAEFHGMGTYVPFNISKIQGNVFTSGGISES